MPNNFGFRLVPDGDGGFALQCEDSHPVVSSSTPPGNRLRAKYRAVYDAGHNRCFVKEKDIDQYARIQSFKSVCLIDNLIRRYQNGDVLALNAVSGYFGDFSKDMDLRSVYDSVNKVRSYFDSLSDSDKSKFGGSYDAFLSYISSYRDAPVPDTPVPQEQPKEVKIDAQ